MPEHALFYVVFMFQIILISAYFPSRLLQRVKYIHKNYPASTHPKLYPKSSQNFPKYMVIYRGINIFNFGLGWVLLYLIYTGTLVGAKGIHPMLPWGYFMLQMIPTQWVEYYGFRMSKMMKQEDQRTTKTAILEPRKFFDFMSPTLFGMVMLSYVTVVVCTLTFYGVQLSLDNKAMQLSLILLAGYVFFFTLISWLIYGKKIDPYQSQKDRIRSVRLAINTQCFVMIASALFIIVAAAIDNYDMKPIMPVLMSLFLQGLVVFSIGYILKNNRLGDIDFDVYKATDNDIAVKN